MLLPWKIPHGGQDTSHWASQSACGGARAPEPEESRRPLGRAGAYAISTEVEGAAHKNDPEGSCKTMVSPPTQLSLEKDHGRCRKELRQWHVEGTQHAVFEKPRLKMIRAAYRKRNSSSSRISRGRPNVS